MDWDFFLSGLFKEGRIIVPPVTPLSPQDLQSLRDVLEPYEAIHRAALVGGLPPWDPEPSVWAAAMLLRACQFAIFREYGEQELKSQLGGDEPEPNPAAHYSVDLCFQYLPDLIGFARAASPQDPLVDQMLRWSAHWPLSSVGVQQTKPDQDRIESLLQSESLRFLYADRIIARDDAARLDLPDVRELVRSRLGNYESLAGRSVLRRLQAEAAPADNPEQPQRRDAV